MPPQGPRHRQAARPGQTLDQRLSAIRAAAAAFVEATNVLLQECCSQGQQPSLLHSARQRQRVGKAVAGLGKVDKLFADLIDECSPHQALWWDAVFGSPGTLTCISQLLALSVRDLSACLASPQWPGTTTAVEELTQLQATCSSLAYWAMMCGEAPDEPDWSVLPQHIKAATLLACKLVTSETLQGFGQLLAALARHCASARPCDAQSVASIASSILVCSSLACSRLPLLCALPEAECLRTALPDALAGSQLLAHACHLLMQLAALVLRARPRGRRARGASSSLLDSTTVRLVANSGVLLHTLLDGFVGAPQCLRPALAAAPVQLYVSAHLVDELSTLDGRTRHGLPDVGLHEIMLHVPDGQTSGPALLSTLLQQAVAAWATGLEAAAGAGLPPAAGRLLFRPVDAFDVTLRALNRITAMWVAATQEQLDEDLACQAAPPAALRFAFSVIDAITPRQRGASGGRLGALWVRLLAILLYSAEREQWQAFDEVTQLAAARLQLAAATPPALTPAPSEELAAALGARLHETLGRIVRTLGLQPPKPAGPPLQPHAGRMDVEADDDGAPADESAGDRARRMLDVMLPPWDMLVLHAAEPELVARLAAMLTCHLSKAGAEGGTLDCMPQVRHAALTPLRGLARLLALPDTESAEARAADGAAPALSLPQMQLASCLVARTLPVVGRCIVSSVARQSFGGGRDRLCTVAWLVSARWCAALAGHCIALRSSSGGSGSAAKSAARRAAQWAKWLVGSAGLPSLGVLGLLWATGCMTDGGDPPEDPGRRAAWADGTLMQVAETACELLVVLAEVDPAGMQHARTLLGVDRRQQQLQQQQQRADLRLFSLAELGLGNWPGPGDCYRLRPQLVQALTAAETATCPAAGHAQRTGGEGERRAAAGSLQGVLLHLAPWLEAGKRMAQLPPPYEACAVLLPSACNNPVCIALLAPRAASSQQCRACGRCGGPRYCSKACQQAHWDVGHKLVCVPVATQAGGSSNSRR